MNFTPNNLKRFWSKVEVNDLFGCWNWQGSLTKNGYGHLTCQTKDLYAHRMAWMIANRDIPPGKFIMHKCDNKQCVNPAHLMIGSHKDNMADMVAKGRSNKGESRPRSQLTEEHARIVLASTGILPARILAALFMVSPSLIYKIRNGKRWKHLTGRTVMQKRKHPPLGNRRKAPVG